MRSDAGTTPDAPTDGDSAPRIPKVHARGATKKDPSPRGVKPAELIQKAAEIGADMEMGYFTGEDGEQQPPHPFSGKAICLAMGYSEARSTDHFPRWWPGTDKMRRMVSLIVLVRRAQMDASPGSVPWLDAALAASVEELLRRLYVSPEAINSRELVDLATKLARMNAERQSGGQKNGTTGSIGTLPPGSRVFQRITETIAELPPDEQVRQRRALEQAITRLRDQTALPAEAAS